MAISRADRAKQFLAFDALKGLHEALRQKEIEHEQKVDNGDIKLEDIMKTERNQS